MPPVRKLNPQVVLSPERTTQFFSVAPGKISNLPVDVQSPVWVRGSHLQSRTGIYIGYLLYLSRLGLLLTGRIGARRFFKSVDGVTLIDRAIPLALKTCLKCGKDFQPGFEDQLYCCRTCGSGWRGLSESAKFEAHVIRNTDPDGCWEWMGSITRDGYGYFSHQRARISAYRWAYTFYKGPIPPGLVIDHLCRNTSCTNPKHLEAVTIKENIRRGLVSSKTYCKHGHLFEFENTYFTARGSRECLTCRRIRARMNAALPYHFPYHLQQAQGGFLRVSLCRRLLSLRLSHWVKTSTEIERRTVGKKGVFVRWEDVRRMAKMFWHPGVDGLPVVALDVFLAREQLLKEARRYY